MRRGEVMIADMHGYGLSYLTCPMVRRKQDPMANAEGSPLGSVWHGLGPGLCLSRTSIVI